MKNETMIPQSDYNHLGLNIARLREIYGESQKDLADAVGLTKAAIANYEVGLRIPTRDNLRAIAKHYALTVSNLLNGDFSKDKIQAELPVVDSDLQMYSISKVLPFIYSDEDMENESFQKASKLMDELFETVIYDVDSWDASLANKCTELFEKAADEGVWTAYAGLLWWDMFLLIEAVFVRKNKMDFLAHVNSRTTALDTIHQVFLSTINDEEDEKMDEETVELIKEKRKDAFGNIYCLKQSDSSELGALGDYYLALCYVFNIIDNGLSLEENRLIGHEMLNIQCLFKNQYAIDFRTAFDHLDEK